MYRKDPCFGVKKKKETRQEAAATKGVILFKTGCQGKKIDEYLNELIRTEIGILCTDGHNSISRKPGFSKSKLRDHYRKAGLEYGKQRKS